MSRYGDHIDYIDECVLGRDDIEDDEALEAAIDAMTFVLSLHELLQNNGYDLPDEPDVRLIESIIDSLYGELAAASLFLSEDAFVNAPKMLRGISKSFDVLDSSFTDEEGVTGPSVPPVVRKGFSKLADRIEATRKQKALLADMKKVT